MSLTSSKRLPEAGDAQQLVYYRGHAPALPLHHLQALCVVANGFGVFAGVLALGEDYGHRRAQLVRGVGGEALFGVEAPLQPVEHAVEGGGEAVYLVAAAVEAYARREVRAVVYRVDGVGYLPHGLEGVARYEPADDGGYRHQRGQEYEREYGDHPGGGEVVVLVRDPAEPDPAVPVGHEQVVDQQAEPIRLHAAYLAVLELVRAREAACPRPAQQLASRRVDLDVDVVAVKVQLVQVEIAVLVLHVVYLVVYDVEQRALGTVGYDAAPGHEYGHKLEPDYEQHHQRKIYRDPCLYRKEPHCSSLSTQPTPRTVCMSFVPRPASIFRRR